jgi:transcriptional regulator with XRE-family HTH domain
MQEARLPAGMPLRELRRTRRISQQSLAEALGARQPSVSRLECQGDMHVSTLRKYIAGLGGTLEIAARFPGGAVHRLRFAP